MPLLAVLGAAIGNSRWAKVDSDWSEPPIIWSTIVAKSGTGKSPAADAAMAPLEKLQRENPHRRYYTGDATVEALGPLLQQNPKGILVHRDELNGWFKSFNEFKPKGGGDESRWVHLFGGRSLAIDRKGQPALIVPRATVSVSGTIQPGVLKRTIRPEAYESGLLARILLAMPPERAHYYSDACTPPEIVESFDSLLRNLHQLEVEEDGSPVLVGLTGEAKDLWKGFERNHEDERMTLDDDLAAAWSKLKAYSIRLALVDHCVRKVKGQTCSDNIDTDSMQVGITLVQWFGNETRRVYAFLKGEVPDKTAERIKKIQSKGSAVTTRDWMRSGVHKKAPHAREELDDLVQQGLGEWKKVGRKKLFFLTD